MDPAATHPSFRVPRWDNKVKQEELAGAGRKPQNPGQRRPAAKLTPPFFLVLLALCIAVALFYQNFFSLPPTHNNPSTEIPPTVQTPLTKTQEKPYPALPQNQEDNYTMSASEQTFIAIKPDGVQRGLIGPIISRFEQRGYKLAAIKLVTPSKQHLEAHYADLKEKPFFPGLISYMLSGPICAMIWEGRDAVKTGRTLLGATNPLASAPGTIRGDFAIDVGRNVCHGSDSVENAKKEIALWFTEGDVVSYKPAQFDWIYEKP